MIEEAVEIKNINFGVLSPKDILNISVCELYNSKLSGPNSLYDQRMGSMKNNQLCHTCGLNPKLCPGHYGHIDLVEPIIHPLYYRYAVSFLKCFCVKCHFLLINSETISVNNSTHMSGEAKFKAILDQIVNLDYCYKCSTQQPKFLFSISESIIYASYKNGTKNQKKIVMEVKDIYDIFNDITDNDIVSLGLNPRMIHPRNLILTILPVVSPISRPFVITDNMVCDDDLTIQYIEIIKIANHLREENLSDAKRQKYIFSLKFRVKCLMDNSHGKSRHTN